MVKKLIRNYMVKAQSNAQLSKIEEHMEKEDYMNPDFQEYFHVWKANKSRIYYFIKEKFFVNRCGVENYAIALLQYVNINQALEAVHV